METTFRINQTSRNFSESFLKNLSLDQLNKIPDNFKNNIIWNIGHIIVTQQLLVYKLSGLPMKISDELIAKYQKGTKPEKPASQEEVDEIRSLLFSTIEKTKEDYENGVFKNFMQYTTQTGNFDIHNVEDALEFNNYHEALHVGVMLQLKKFV
ncbi:DinB family protein [Flavobacterium sp. NRK F10]|uniref:DinB family protein n=2 Tax=Flavobacteriaceae TaxID=49546 RepID=A0A2U8QTM6_9FLAO|nr:DinB family protein [Flavobacterium sediminis]MCO6174642.1 DinB family protein [Flavobacterium sp. NRK F10]